MTRASLAAFAALGLVLSPVAAHAHGRPPLAAQTASAAVSSPLELHPIVAEAERHLGQGNFTGRPGPWCAFFVSAVLRAVGLRPLAGGMAASALAYGPRLAAPEPGALAVTWRHVGIVEAVNGDGTVTTINGNWGGRVRRARLARAGLIFVRA